MVTNDYMKWLSSTTSCWWIDSANLNEMDQAIENGATGVTTNPLLVKRSLYGFREDWKPYLADMDKSLKGDEKAEELIRRVTVQVAAKFEPIFRATNGVQGYVCAQVNPCYPGDTDLMLNMAKRLSKWAPNIAVKLPATAAGLDAMEECAALGITTVGTVSFTVPQAVEIARRQWMGEQRAKKAGITPGKAFSVVMVGRLDDYLRDVAHDNRAAVLESDIRKSGTAVIKRAYAIVRERGYSAKLMPAGMRGGYHALELAGADMSMSIGTGIQQMLLAAPMPYSEGILEDVESDVIARLMTMREFVRAYEPDGMRPEDFISYGTSQKTLSQFVEAGWFPIQAY